MYYIYTYIYTYSIYTYNYMHSCLIFVGANNLVNTMSFSTSSSQLSKMWICQRISRQPKGSLESQGRWWEDVYAVCLHMGLSLNGGTPINGWFISWKIPNKNRWLRGTSILGNPFYPPKKTCVGHLEKSIFLGVTKCKIHIEQIESCVDPVWFLPSQ